jgi:hypothetical protein
MMHTKRWQKAGSAITTPFAERRPCLPLLPVGSCAVMGQPTNNGQHDVSHHSYHSDNTATLGPFDRYRMARP